MSDPNSNPVTIPPGSYDYADLKSGLDKAAKGAASKYDNSVRDTIARSADIPPEERDRSAEPGYVTVPVTHEVLGVVEHIQVFDPKLGEKLSREEAIPSAADLQNRQAEVAAEAAAVAGAATPKE